MIGPMPCGRLRVFFALRSGGRVSRMCIGIFFLRERAGLARDFGPDLFDMFAPYHFLHDQYLAVILFFAPALSHPCRARNDLRRLGFDFLMVMLASPKRMIFSLPPEHAFTTNFLPPWTCRFGLLQAIFDLLIGFFAIITSVLRK